MAKTLDEVPVWLRVVIGVLIFAILVGGTSWTASRIFAANSFLVSSHETRITKTESSITLVKKDVSEFKEAVDKRFDSSERMQFSLQKDQQSILRNQGEMKLQLLEQSKLQIEQIRESAKLGAYLRSIERIE